MQLRPLVDPTPIPATTPVPQVQGSGAISAYEGKQVTVAGVVTAIQRTGNGAGFFLQDAKGDGDAATSDAIFVRMGDGALGWLDDVTTGAKAFATGIVSERGGFTAVEVAKRGALLIGHIPGAAAIEPERLDIPVDDAGRIQYLESREGMFVTIADALVVGPTTTRGQYVAVDAEKHGARRMGSTPDVTGPIHVNGKLGPKTQLMVGDRVGGLRGPLGVSAGTYEVLPIGNYKSLERGPQPPKAFGDLDGDDRFTANDRAALTARIGTVASGPLDPADLDGNGQITRADRNRLDARSERERGGPKLAIANLNALDFFDPDDAPAPIDDEVPSSNAYRTKLAKLAGAIRDRLGSPELLALQEVENTRVLDDLLARPELQALGYRYVQLPTTGRRSINPTLLYREGAAEVIGSPRQVQRAALPGHRVTNLDGEPLFAREPLVVDLRLKTASGEPGRELTLIVNHFISKFSPHGLPTDPIRVEQATFLREYVDTQRQEHPEREVVVLGDLNDTQDSAALKALTGPRREPTLINTTATMAPEAERYSYVFNGKSELIDHVLVTPGLVDQLERAGVRHGNADLAAGESWDATPARASDHDSPYVWLRLEP